MFWSHCKIILWFIFITDQNHLADVPGGLRISCFCSCWALIPRVDLPGPCPRSRPPSLGTCCPRLSLAASGSVTSAGGGGEAWWPGAWRSCCNSKTVQTAVASLTSSVSSPRRRGSSCCPATSSRWSWRRTALWWTPRSSSSRCPATRRWWSWREERCGPRTRWDENHSGEDPAGKTSSTRWQHLQTWTINVLLTS